MGTTWFDIARFEEGDEIVYRYQGMLDTRASYENLGSLPSYAISEARKELDSTEFQFTLILPGVVGYANGGTATGSRITWDIRNNDLNQIVGESRLPKSGLTGFQSGDPQSMVRMATGLLFILGNILMLVFLFGFRKKSKTGEAEA